MGSLKGQLLGLLWYLLLCVHVHAMLLDPEDLREFRRSRSSEIKILDVFPSPEQEAIISLRLELIHTLMENDTSNVTGYMDMIKKLVGKPDWEAGVMIDKNSSYGMLQFAYHFHVPPKLDTTDYNRKVHRRLKKISKLWQAVNTMDEYERACHQALEIAKNNKNPPYRVYNVEKEIEKCSNGSDYVEMFIDVIKDKDHLEQMAEDGLMYAIDIVAESYWYSCFIPAEGGRELAHFPRMLQETNALDTALRQAFRDANNRMNDLISLNYTNEAETVHNVTMKAGSWYIDILNKGSLLSIRNPEVLQYRKETVELFCNDVSEFYTDWSDVYKNWETSNIQTAPEMLFFFIIIKYINENFLINTLLDPLKNVYADDYGIYCTPEYHPCPICCIHNMRLAWRELSLDVEYVKYYANRTYYNNWVRAEALKDAQANIKANRTMFNKISHTLGEFCHSENETNIVGSCTRENNEICSPMTLSPQWEDPDDETRGGLSILKPKFIITKNAETGKDRILPAYVIKYNTCRCGFRMDCGTDLEPKENITCILQPNNHILKQCRGSIGYPCKTHPFAPNKHHESCVTGFCDMEYNSCESGPHKVTRDSGVGRLAMDIMINCFIAQIAFLLSCFTLLI